MEEKKDKSESKYTINLEKAKALSKSWKKSENIWRILNLFFTMGPIAFSMIVVFISIINMINRDYYIILFSSLSGVLSLVGCACNPIKYVQGYRMAYEELDNAIDSYKNKHSKIKTKERYKEIGDAIKQAETYIGTTFEVGVAIYGVDNVYKAKKKS